MLQIAGLLCLLFQLHRGVASVPTIADSITKVASNKGSKAPDAHPFTDHLPPKPKRLERLTLENRPDIVQGHMAPKELNHKIIIVRKQKNLQLLESELLEVSNPRSAKYGQHLTKDQIAEFTSNTEAVNAIQEYLRSEGIVNVTTTRYDDYITAEATIAQWERILNAEFYEFEHAGAKDKRFIRSLKYTIPGLLEEHVEAIFNTVQLPDHHFGKKLQFQARPQDVSTLATGTVTPSLLNDLYNIASNTGNSLTDQAVYAILNQQMSPNDLTEFQQSYGIPVQPISSSVGNHVSNNACDDVNDCIEANLDVQYLMAVAQAVPTVYYYWTGTDVWLDWITTVADLADPPDLFTISYGSYEIAFDPAYLEAFKTEAIKLGLAGTTLLAASGDDGVSGWQTRTGDMPCGYFASFPASCPYVTAVGATMGPESNTAEVACQSDGGSSITTGGGFSHYYTLPLWQTSEVTDYFTQVMGTDHQPQSGYNAAMRGYPDISVLGNKYEIIAGGTTYYVSGTSASSPVMAGMVALVNSARRAQGNSTLGWLNPALYGLYPAFANDITSGDNKCLVSGYSCCTQGFYCSTGWDPVTGLGSLDFEQFRNAMLDIDSSDYASFEPSSAPTLAPGYEGWVLYEGFSSLDCPTGNKQALTTQSGFPTEACMVLYDSNSQPVGSTMYSCTFAVASQQTFSDLNCSANSLQSTDDISYVCQNYAASSSIARSVQARCASAEDLPLPVGVFAVEREFNEDTCPLESTADFNSWRLGYCFRSGFSSFKFTATDPDIAVTFYSGIDCDSQDEEGTTAVPTECTAVDLTSLAADEASAGINVLYKISDIKDDDDDSAATFLGLSLASAIAIGVVVVCVALIVLIYSCYLGCRGTSPHRATTIPTRDPVGHPVAVAHATARYEEHPVAVVTLAHDHDRDRGHLQMV